MKRISGWKKTLLLVGVLSSSCVFQTTACTQTSAAIAATGSVVTAGGVLYLVSRVLGD